MDAQGRRDSDPGLGWGRLQTAAQVLLFSVIMGLLWIDVFLRRHGTAAASAISGATYILILMAIVVIVLPRLSSISFELPGVKAQMAMRSARVARQTAARAGGAAAATRVAREASPATDQAVANPVTSIEMSRRALTAELFKLAENMRDANTGEPASTARALSEARRLDPETADAVAKVAEAIAQGQQVRRPSPALALEIDYATQLMIGELRSHA